MISTNAYTGILLNQTTYGNSKITNYSYDGLNRISTMSAGAGIPIPSYTYNDASDILGDGTKSYTYDGLVRLISATPTSTGSINQTTESYTYDKAGNRTLGTIGGSSTNYGANTLDQYTTLTGATNITNTYDSNGNLSSDGTRSYKYDYNNRLIEVNIGTGNLVKYQYDILGRRTKKIDSSKSITNPESTIYVYSGDNILSEYKTTGSLTLKKNYINGIGTDNVIAYDVDESTNQGQISFCLNRVLSYSSEFTTYGYSSIVNDCNATINSSTGIVTNRYYYHTNQLGSIIALTSSTGALVQVYSYDAFGKVYVVNSGSLTSLDNYAGNTYSNSRLYTGREYDRETKLYYLRARYYNPETGKFISRDPIGQKDQINLYTYVGNSPLIYVDRNGKEKKFIAAYDEYNQFKDLLDNISFASLDAETRVSVLVRLNELEEKAKSLHYARNTLNTGLPENAKQAKEWGWKTIIATYHQYGVPEGKENVKYISQDGHKEVVFRFDTGLEDNSPENEGTYNFFSPTDNKIKHIQYDIKPWEEWGNVLKDSTTYDQRKQIYTGLF